jgi:hypothetical protein
LCAGDGTVHTGEVLAYKAASGQHLLFYEDGEHEWAHLAAQPNAAWAEPLPGATSAPGLPEGALSAHTLTLPFAAAVHSC